MHLQLMFAPVASAGNWCKISFGVALSDVPLQSGRGGIVRVMEKVKQLRCRYRHHYAALDSSNERDRAVIGS